MRIGIDLDGVCYPFAEVITLYGEHTLGRRLAPAHLSPKWSFFEDWGMSGSEFGELMKAGHDVGLVYHIGSPPPNCRSTLTQLRNRGHELVVCTHRPDYAHGATQAWLDRWQLPYDELVICTDKTLHRLDVLLDDGPHNIEAMVGAGGKAVVFDQPWNQHVQLNGKVRRCYGWASAAGQLVTW